MILLLSAEAFACGAFFGPEPVISDSQVVAFRPGSGSTEVEYRVAYAGDAEDFGWVIPVPGDVEEVEEGDPDALMDAVQDSEPSIEHYYDEPRFGCSGKGDDLTDSSGGMGTDSGLVEGSGSAGIFEWTALSGEESEPLISWLDERGFVNGDTSAIEDYVAEGGWTFIALSMTQTPDGAGDSGWGHTMPQAAVRITYAGDDIRYPAHMTSTSGAERQTTTILVFGDERATVSGWSSAKVGDLFGDIDDDPAELYADRLWDLGGDSPGYGLVYAQAYRGEWLTRFDAMALSTAHTEDAVFAIDGGTDPVSSSIQLYEKERDRDKAENALFLLPLGLLGLIGLRRRQ
ncbi:MAG TPA: DUF2330 domain-containing protein [Myxococcota bacterium]|nr:DUF2330 domain-containing protein [Myxococcota bacterium]